MFAQVTYDCFNMEKDKFGDRPNIFDLRPDVPDGGPESLRDFTKYGLCFKYQLYPGGPDAPVKCEYDFSQEFSVVKSIYTKALSTKSETTWGGYIAVQNEASAGTDGKRDVVIAWRGTISNKEWGANAQGLQTLWRAPDAIKDDDGEALHEGWAATLIENVQGALNDTPWRTALRKLTDVIRAAASRSERDVQVHGGFQYLYNCRCDQAGRTKPIGDNLSPRTVVLRTLKQLQADGVDIGRVIVTGHSLGGALATLCAYDVAQAGLPVLLVTWASPRVGNPGFSASMDKVVPHHVRIEVDGDVVPDVPKIGYKHAGHELLLDPAPLRKKGVTYESKKTIDRIGQRHNLEHYMQLVDGTRPYELLCKSDNLLTDEYLKSLHVTNEWMSSKDKEGEWWPRHLKAQAHAAL